jgi:hypothetical protein
LPQPRVAVAQRSGRWRRPELRVWAPIGGRRKGPSRANPGSPPSDLTSEEIDKLGSVTTKSDRSGFVRQPRVKAGASTLAGAGRDVIGMDEFRSSAARSVGRPHGPAEAIISTPDRAAPGARGPGPCARIAIRMRSRPTTVCQRALVVQRDRLGDEGEVLGVRQEQSCGARDRGACIRLVPLSSNMSRTIVSMFTSHVRWEGPGSNYRTSAGSHARTSAQRPAVVSARSAS